MQTRITDWRAAVFPSLFALICVILLIVVWVQFGGTLPFAPQAYEIRLPLPNATNVYPDTSVRIAGITVGHVLNVQRTQNGADAVLSIQPQYAPLRTGATAIVRFKTLLGEAYIEIAPGPNTAPAIRDNGTFPASQVQPNQQLFDVLGIFTPDTRARLRTLLAGLQTATNGTAQPINNTLGNLAPATTNLATVLTALNGQTRPLQTLTADTGTVLSALGTNTGTIQALVTNGNAALAATAQANSGLRGTIAALPPFLRQLRSSSTILTGASGDLNAAITTLQQATPNLAATLQAISTVSPVLSRLFRSLPPVLRAGIANLPRLDQVLAAARPALAELYPALRQLIPILQLLSVDRASVVGSLANDGQVGNGVFTGPGVGNINYEAGTIALWNESIGGWVHKLPTNRSNPYPAPNSELDIAHGGLRAYDCRNTGNPLILPPTGTGAPPCLLQGPWTFDGHSAYYPRLQQAPP